jgi:hypothetical protein
VGDDKADHPVRERRGPREVRVRSAHKTWGQTVERSVRDPKVDPEAKQGERIAFSAVLAPVLAWCRVVMPPALLVGF